MYNVIKTGKIMPNSRPIMKQNVKNRKRMNRSKNSSIEMNHVIYPEMDHSLPKISNTGKLISKKIYALDRGKKNYKKLDMEIIENGYNHNQKGNLSYDDVYDNLKGFRKSNKPPSSDFNSSDRNSGIINYRAVTGISAPNRSKVVPPSRQSDVIAPWKINKRNSMNRKEVENYIDRRSMNRSSKQNKNNIKSGSKASRSQKNKEKLKGHKIPKITNKNGLNSNSDKHNEENIKVLPIQNTYKRVNNMGENMNMFKTPAYITPNESMKTEKVPLSKSQESYSKASNHHDYNDSSMLEKHTIVFDSDTEFYENNSDAPTESQYIQHKQTIYMDESSIVEGGTPMLDPSQEFIKGNKEDEEKPPHFNENDSKNLATFREKHKSQSDINYEDEDLEELQNDARAAKTALAKSRIFVNNSKETMKKVHPSQDHRDDEDLQNQLEKLNISPSEKEKFNDQIYLNTNSAEENPEQVDGELLDSESLSKHTLCLHSHTSKEEELHSHASDDEGLRHHTNDEEGESGMSYKEIVIYSNKNLQISPENSPFMDKNLQITPKDAPFIDQILQTSIESTPNLNFKPKEKGRKYTEQSEYITKEMSKLQFSGGRREKAKSSKAPSEQESPLSQSKWKILI